MADVSVFLILLPGFQNKNRVAILAELDKEKRKLLMQNQTSTNHPGARYSMFTGLSFVSTMLSGKREKNQCFFFLLVICASDGSIFHKSFRY